MASVILVADGDASAVSAVVEALAGRGVADRVEACESGRALVAAFARALHQADEVVGVVLDTKLPIGGGRSSALAVRAVEKAFETPPAPIVFYLEGKADSNLDKIIAYLGCGAHCQRDAAGPGAADGIDALVERLEELRT